MNEALYDFIKMIITSTLTAVLTVLVLTYIQGLDDTNLGDIDHFVKVAKKWADSHEYDIGVYDCQNFSKDVNEIANLMDIESEIIRGCPVETNETCHRWLRLTLDFEPQYAEFTDYSKEFPLKRRVIG